MLSIVATVYNKSPQLDHFLSHFTKQTCKDFELILVDDCSKDDIYSIVKKYQSLLNIKYIRLGKNSGQCTARNTGLKEVEGDIVAIVDSDCIPGSQFVQLHSQPRNPKTVFIGPYNIESGNTPVAQIVSSLNGNPERVSFMMKSLPPGAGLQIPDTPSHFLNFVTRNVSLLTSDLPKNRILFDPAFAYSMDPNSGFGWEDSDVGATLKKQGFTFQYLEAAFTIHDSHPSMTPDNVKAGKSAKNFYRLLAKHPELITDPTSKEWALNTYKKIATWILRSAGTVSTTPMRYSEKVVVCRVKSEDEMYLPLFLESMLTQENWSNRIVLLQDSGFNSRVAAYYQGVSPYIQVLTQPLERFVNENHNSQILVFPSYVICKEFPKFTTGVRILDSAEISEVTEFARIKSHLKSKSTVEPVRPKVIAPKTKLKILSYSWHHGHQYELQKLPHEFTYISNNGQDDWNYNTRPLGSNVVFRRWEDIDQRNYDLAILHFDENILTPSLARGILQNDWGLRFINFRNLVTQIPTVAICHGTPPFHGMFDLNYTAPDLMQEITEEKMKLVDFVGSMPIVCNSHKAQQEWGFQKSRTIWHGFNIIDYPLTTYREPIVYIANSIRHRPHYRGYFWFKKLSKKYQCWYLGRDDLNEFKKVVVPSPVGKATGNMYAKAKFAHYVNTIRRFSVFLNTTIRSPMPRSRAEAMMCGLAIVTTNFHDEDMFIEHGVDGFVGTTIEELDSALEYLTRNPTQAQKIGCKGRAKASKVFSSERYLNDWKQMIGDVLGGKI